MSRLSTDDRPWYERHIELRNQEIARLRAQNAKLLAACEAAKHALNTIGWGDDKWDALYEQLCDVTKQEPGQ